MCQATQQWNRARVFKSVCMPTVHQLTRRRRLPSVRQWRGRHMLEAVRNPIVLSTAASTILSYSLLSTAQASRGCAICGLASAAMIGSIFPRFVSDEEFSLIHWVLFAAGTLLAAGVMAAVLIHNFNPYAFALCPFCGRPLA